MPRDDLQRPDPSRRAVLGVTALGISATALPAAQAAASDASAAAVAAWSDSATLTFSDPTTSGFTVSWDPAA